MGALDAADPAGDILAAWIAEELLPDVLAHTATGGMRYDIAAALQRFYAFCAATHVPEIHDLARTIETWQKPMILAIATGLSNARSEGSTASSNTSGALHSASATPTTNDAEYGGPAPANHGRRHPGPGNYTPANSVEPGNPIPSPAILEKMGIAFRRTVQRFGGRCSVSPLTTRSRWCGFPRMTARSR